MRLYLRLGFCDDSAAFFNKAVRWITGGPGHVVVEVFDGRETVIYESVWKKDEHTHKSGVRMAPLAKIHTWLQEKPKTRIYYTVPEDGYLPLTEAEAAYAVTNLNDAVRTIHYAKLQLGRNLLARFGVRINFGNDDDVNWTCCETPIRSRVFPPRMWGALNLDHYNPDESVPGGSGRYSLEAGARRIVAAFGTVRPVTPA